VLLKDLQDKVDVCSVPFVVFFFHLSRLASGVNGNVVHVDGEPSLGDLFSEDGIHHHLKCCRGVGEAKEHYRWFEESFRGEEGGLPFVPRFDPNVIIPPADIELCKEGATAKVIYGLWDERRDIVVPFCPFIHRLVVLHWTQLSVFLFNKEEVGSIGASRLMNHFSLQVLRYEFVGFHYFILF
jgi:hypothetical protein